MALASSLVLSDAAQKFAVAREISHSSTNLVTTHAALNGISIFALYFLSRQFNRKAKLFTRPLKLRVVLYTLLGGLVGTVGLFIKDFTTYQRASCKRAKKLHRFRKNTHMAPSSSTAKRCSATSLSDRCSAPRDRKPTRRSAICA